MSKKQKRIITITAVTLLIAAVIVAAVLTVVKISEKKRAAKEIYVTAEQLKETKLPDKTYDNLDLSNAALNMPQFDDIYDIQWSLNDNYTEEECITLCDEIGQKVWSGLEQRGMDMSKVVCLDDYENELPDRKPRFDKVGASISFESTDKPDGMYRTTYGFAVFDTNGTMQMYCYPPSRPQMQYSIRKIIRLDLGEQPDDKMYRTVDGEMSVKQAIELAQQEAENYSQYIVGEVRPAYVYVYQYDEGYSDLPDEIIDEDNGNPYFFDVYFDKVYEGIPFFSNGMVQYMAEAERGMGDIIIRQPQMFIEIGEKSGAWIVETVCGYPVEKAVKHEENKYLSLQTACDKISDLFAPGYEIAVDEISFKYALKFLFADEVGSKHQALPCWCFSVYGPPGSSIMMENTIYVDAVTGTVYFMPEGSVGYYSSDETDMYIN